MVTAGHELAANAGVAILADGGNAVDAAVATAWAVGVVEPWMSGVGGVGAAIVHVDGQQHAIDFGLKAPKRARPDMYQILDADSAAGQWGWPPIVDRANEIGPLSVGVPGVVAGLEYLHQRFGRLPREQVMEPAIALASDGFDVDWYASLMIALHHANLSTFPAARSLFLRPDGSIPLPSVLLSTPDRLRQRDLGGTLTKIARDGATAFYRGEIAEAIASYMEEVGGFLDAVDLADYTPVAFEKPTRSGYRQVEVVGVPGATGGAIVHQALNILEEFNVADLGFASAGSIELLASAFDVSYQDFFQMAQEARSLEKMITKGHARESVSTMAGGKRARRSNTAPRGGHTTHLCVVDADRNGVSLTQTLGHLFGSTVVVPSTGVLVNDMMVVFDPRVGRSQSVAPGQRQSTPVAPTLLLSEGELIAAIGAPGGRRIPTSIVQVISNIVDHGMGVGDAIAAPRVHAEGGELLLDTRFEEGLAVELEKRGRDVVTADKTVVSYNFAQPSAVLVRGESIVGATDPFCPAVAIGL